METNQVPSRPSSTVDEVLGAYPIKDDFLDNANPTDMSIDTANSEGKMVGGHITRFHTQENKQPIITELLTKVLNASGADVNLLSQENQNYDNQHDQHLMTCKHDAGRGQHNQSDPQSTKPVDYKIATCKDESSSSDAVKSEGVAKIMEDTLKMAEKFINAMVLKTSHIDAPAVVKDNDKTTVVNKLGKDKPVVVHENNNDAMKLGDNVLKSSNTLIAYIVEEKEG